ncbi:MAG: hypothetical protein LZ174_07595 [Thaumarchaeota archaeon]|jgi:hypothetical protein|nr:hypothetical protein [Candidatus Geocrenenecus arthurdayi]
MVPKYIPVVVVTLLLTQQLPILLIAAQESQPTLTTDRDFYLAGDIVRFNASGLQPNSNYTLQVLYHDSVVYSIEFNSTSDGSIPLEIYWNSTSNPSGTYVVQLLDAEGGVAGEIFGLVQVNKYEFLPEESIVIMGGGVEPNSIVVIIVSDGSIIFNGSVTADENGEFQVIVPIPFNTTYGSYQIMIYSRGIEFGPDLVFNIFVNSTLSNLIDIMGVDLATLIEVVSEINVTIQQSILAKLLNALKKIEQAEHHLLLNRSHVAWNMLNAAENILNACINEVNAQSGKHLDNETAASINISLQEVMNKLEATKLSLDKPHGGQKQSNGTLDNDKVGGNYTNNSEANGKSKDVSNKQSERDKHNQNDENDRGKGRSRNKR